MGQIILRLYWKMCVFYDNFTVLFLHSFISVYFRSKKEKKWSLSLKFFLLSYCHMCILVHMRYEIFILQFGSNNYIYIERVTKKQNWVLVELGRSTRASHSHSGKKGIIQGSRDTPSLHNTHLYQHLMIPIMHVAFYLEPIEDMKFF